MNRADLIRARAMARERVRRRIEGGKALPIAAEEVAVMAYLRGGGMGPAEIGRLFGLPEKSVRRALKRQTEAGQELQVRR